MHLAPLVALVALVGATGSAHDLAECRRQHRAKDGCLVEAARRALGAKVGKETGKALLKACLSKNNCKVISVNEEESDKIRACLTNELGFDPYARIERCLNEAGHPVEERTATETIVAALPVLSARVKQQCAGGDAAGALHCIRAELGIDLNTVDPVRVVADVCKAKPACDAQVSAGCESLLQERRRARTAAGCDCHRRLAGQVGRRRMAPIERKCLPRRLHAHFGHTVCQAVDNPTLRMETISCPEGS